MCTISHTCLLYATRPVIGQFHFSTANELRGIDGAQPVGQNMSHDTYHEPIRRDVLKWPVGGAGGIENKRFL